MQCAAPLRRERASLLLREECGRELLALLRLGAGHAVLQCSGRERLDDDLGRLVRCHLLRRRVRVERVPDQIALLAAGLRARLEAADAGDADLVAVREGALELLSNGDE